MNPILNALNQTGQPTGSNQDLEQARQMYQAYRTAADPARFVNDVMQRNPIIAQLARSGNLQQTFYDMCRQRGVDPQTIINGIRR